MGLTEHPPECRVTCGFDPHFRTVRRGVPFDVAVPGRPTPLAVRDIRSDKARRRLGRSWRLDVDPEGSAEEDGDEGLSCSCREEERLGRHEGPGGSFDQIDGSRAGGLAANACQPLAKPLSDGCRDGDFGVLAGLLPFGAKTRCGVRAVLATAGLAAEDDTRAVFGVLG